MTSWELLECTFPVSASYFKQPGSIQGVRVYFQLETSGFGINVDALVFNSVSGTDASGTVVRYKVRPLGFFLPGEPGRRYVTSFCFLRAEFRLVCHNVGLADGEVPSSRVSEVACIVPHES